MVPIVVISALDAIDEAIECLRHGVVGASAQARGARQARGTLERILLQAQREQPFTE